jgi:hypothetical protein
MQLRGRSAAHGLARQVESVLRIFNEPVVVGFMGNYVLDNGITVDHLQRRQGSAGFAGIELTPAMIEAGEERLGELLQAGSGSAYVVEQVFLSMCSKAGASERTKDQA